MTLIDTIKEWRNKKEREMLQNGMDDDERPREVKDGYLDSLRRERQYQMNQDEKEHLKETIAAYKKQKMRERLYGIKDKREKENSYLGNQILKKKVKVLKDSNNMLKQKSMMRQKSILSARSLLNNRREEFKRRSRSYKKNKV